MSRNWTFVGDFVPKLYTYGTELLKSYSQGYPQVWLRDVSTLFMVKGLSLAAGRFHTL